MAAMLLRVLLLIYVSGVFGHIFRKHLEYDNPIMQLQGTSLKNPTQIHKDLYPHNPSQQWQDLVTFVNRKIEGMEQLLTEKDERIDRLELTIAGQTNDIKQLEQGMTSLEEKVSEKDEVVNRLVTRISDLERIVIFDGIASKPETQQRTNSQVRRTYNESVLSNITSVSRSESKIEKTLTQQFAIPGTSNIQNDSNTPNHSEQRIRNDDNRLQNQPVEDNTAVNMEKRSKESPIADFSRCQQKRVVPSSFPAFHVALSRDKAVTPDTIVIYDHETLDQGQGYITGTGYYIVPESGTYVITWTTICAPHNLLQTVLVVNGVVRGSSLTDAQEINDYHQTTAVVVLTLNQGEHVFIRMGHTYGQGTIVTRSYLGESTFSGWKIH